ncbi:hypothetical protein [Gemmatimonas sp.]|uniref:hypothetical protein n=1 Tax=Gemmatimonas sp. TaxID=1962908 RepID=UPI003DA22F12
MRSLPDATETVAERKVSVPATTQRRLAFTETMSRTFRGVSTKRGASSITDVTGAGLTESGADATTTIVVSGLTCATLAVAHALVATASSRRDMARATWLSGV